MTRWNIDDDLAGSGQHAATLFVSLNFIRAALLRRWKTIAVFVCGGVCLAIAALVLLPPASTATTSLILAHPANEDPTTAMATDVTLVTTRTVAQNTIDALKLPMTPDELLKAVSVTAPTPDIMAVSLKAPTPALAVQRLSAYVTAYLNERAAEIHKQTSGLVTGDQTRITQLQQQTKTLSQQYDVLSKRSDASSQSQAADVLNHRSQLDAEIVSLQQDIQQNTLQADSIIVASHTVDSPAVVPAHAAKRLVLIMMSGLIVGTAMGVGLVLFHALLSTRLRRRDEVALALGRSVRFSTGLTRSWWPWRSRLGTRDLDVLAAGLGTALDDDSAPQRVALVSVGAPTEAARVTCRLADHLVEVGVRVCVVDLSESGALKRVARRAQGWVVLRPEGTVAMATGPLALVSTFSGKPKLGDPGRDEWKKAQVVLVLGDAELGVGAGPLSTWADRAVLLVRAGRASAEFLDSVGRVFDASGLNIEFAMLVGADSSDESPGFPAGLAREARVSRSS